MDELILKTKRYLEDSLDVKAEIKPIDLSGVLPYLYTEYYCFYDMVLNEAAFLICASRDVLSAKMVRTHLCELEKRMGKRTVYLNSIITPNLRRSLVENRVAFIIPGNQMYLPDLGIVFKEYYKTSRSPKHHLSPIAQLILIRTLVNRDYTSFTANEYASILSYSAMGISRAFDQLLAHNLISKEEQWRRKPISWITQGKELWETAQPLLVNPIRKTIWIKTSSKLPYCIAGISALAKYSMLSEGDEVTYATNVDHKLNEFHIVPNRQYAHLDGLSKEVQLWSYNPRLITNGDYVDPLSLYLCLKESLDDRIQISLDEMMGGIRW